MDGLLRSTWKPGQPAEELVAPIALAVLVGVSRELRLGELLIGQETVVGGDDG